MCIRDRIKDIDDFLLDRQGGDGDLEFGVYRNPLPRMVLRLSLIHISEPTRPY